MTSISYHDKDMGTKPNVVGRLGTLYTELWSGRRSEGFSPGLRAAVGAIVRDSEFDLRGDASAVDRSAGLLLELARVYGANPFTPLSEVQRSFGIAGEELRQHVEMFASVPELRAVVSQGPAGRYWKNTLLPMESAGVIDDVVLGRPRFPYRIGLYPGPTCMFRCSFCARVTGVRYGADLIPGGTDKLISVIEEAPLDDPYRFYVSGGLEPLTNPRLGELASRAQERGFRMQCYTNAFALTPAVLERQPGLWDFDAIRISLYGVEAEEYETTTTRRGAFAKVMNNIRMFLQARVKNDRQVRVGLNYVVLPGRANLLPKIIDLIADLNTAAPERPLDFLTLREDYSRRPGGGLAEDDRLELLRASKEFEERRAQRTPSLHVDYGYALAAAVHESTATLPFIDHTRLAVTGHPQASVTVDLTGDVYMYREAAFPELPGADRYVIGQLGHTKGLMDIVSDFVLSGRTVEPRPGDDVFLDAFDRTVTSRTAQVRADLAAGWGPARGFLR